MAAPIYTPLPTAPARTMPQEVYSPTADAFVAALELFQAEGNALGAYTQTQAEAALAAALVGNLSDVDLAAMAGWVIGVNADGTALEGIELVPPVQATEIVDGVAKVATKAMAEAGTDDLAMMTALKVLQAIKAQATTTARQTTTSGTEFDFINIPAGVTRIEVLFDEVTLSGANKILVQLGDAGGFETTGYLSSASSSGVDSSSTTGFHMYNDSAPRPTSGIMTLVLADAAANTWIQSHSVRIDAADSSGGGRKNLSAELTQLRVTRSGTNTFSNGAVNIVYHKGN